MTFDPLITWEYHSNPFHYFSVAPLTPLTLSIHLQTIRDCLFIHSQTELNLAILEAKAKCPGIEIVHYVPAKSKYFPNVCHFEYVSNLFSEALKEVCLLDQFSRRLCPPDLYESILDQFGRPV